MSESLPLCDLYFDRGTLVFKVYRPEAFATLSKHPLCIWDPSTQVFRSRPHYYQKIRANLNGTLWIRDNFKKLENSDHAWRPLELRHYQKEALVSWESNEKRGIICLPTGAGKTRVALAAMKQNPVATLCIVPTRVLVHQWMETISQYYPGPVGQFGDGKRSLEFVTVATFESAYRCMAHLGSMFEFVIVDEVHHFGKGLRDEALIMTTAPCRLGLTATPSDDPKINAKIDVLVGSIIYQKNIDDLKGRYLSDFRYTSIPIKLNTSEFHQYDQHYKYFSNYYKAYLKTFGNKNWQHFIEFASRSREGRRAMGAHNRARKIVAMSESKIHTTGQLIKKFPNRKTIFFTSNTETAITLSCLYLIPAITAEIGKNERKIILDSFRKGEIHHIVSCRVLNEGVDIPDADIAVIVGGSSNSREQIQRIGRVLRKQERKTAEIIEFITTGTFEQKHASMRRRAIASY